MRLDHTFLIVLVCSGLLELAFGTANLDIREPIVKRSPATSGDQFGYAVALHHITKPVDGDFESFLNSTRLIVGAPFGTYPGGLQSLPASTPESKTGLVYQCPVGPGDCGGILGNNLGNDRRLFDGDDNLNNENKVGQLMGATLFSNGDYFMACAPLYVIFTFPEVTDLDNSRPVGRCFVSPRRLENFAKLMPCDAMRQSNPQSISNSNNQCLSGFSAAIFVQDNDEEKATVIVGSPGDQSFLGNLYYFSVNGTTVMDTGDTSKLSSRFDANHHYEGYSSTTGFVTNKVTPDIISGIPRFDGSRVFGNFVVRTQADRMATQLNYNVTGTQTGEYFGATIAVADLNNDGYDEVIVGAPIFTSDQILEVGRVYIYENLRGSLATTPITLDGTSVQSRFGSSIVCLGDINDDDFQDIAIGAPYEGSGTGANSSGTVYIYYGRPSMSGLISMVPNQVLLAQTIIDNVPDIDSLHGFGFSLAANVDVDGNDFNDLLIGAHTSQMAVLIRSLSVAYITINISTSTNSIQLDDGTEGSTFNLMVCAHYAGRGLDQRPLTTVLIVSENYMDGTAPRLLFVNGGKEASNFTSRFTFQTTEEISCETVNISTKPIRLLARQDNFLFPIEIRASIVALPRPPPTYVDGSPMVLVDYRDIPKIEVEGNNTVSVAPSVNCPGSSMERMCTPDLTVLLMDVVYLDLDGVQYSSSGVVAGLTQNVRVDLMYVNIGPHPALGSEILFTLPEGFTFVRATVPEGALSVDCLEDGAIFRLYRCPLTNYLPPASEISFNPESQLSLTWRLSRSLVGNEPMQTSNISIGLTSAGDVETNTSNNDLIGGPVQISYSAMADFDISTFKFMLEVLTYRQIQQPVVNPNILQIGKTAQLEFRTVNKGPSNSPNTVIDIYVPTNDTADSFYLYLTNATAVLDNGNTVPCDLSGINPQGLSDPSTSSVTNIKRKRSVMYRRQVDQAKSDSQTAGLNDQLKNCSDPNERASGSCTRIRCKIENFAVTQMFTILISAAVDDRFFQNQRAPFVFVAYSRIQSNDSFLTDTNQTNNHASTVPLRLTLLIEQVSRPFPIWIPIVVGIVIIILFIILFIILYIFGFFRRKRHHAAAESESDIPAPVVESKKPEEDNAMYTDMKSREEGDIDDDDDDIGDASDIIGEEGEKNEFDETSL